MEELVDSREAAGFLRVNVKTLQRLARSGQVRGIKIGKLWRFSKGDLVLGQASSRPFTTKPLKKTPRPKAG